MMGRVDGRRQGRVAQVVRKELAEVLHTGDIRGKRLATSIREMISIVDVDVSPDLRNARVKVSILGDRKDKISAVRWLQSSRGGIRYCMGKRMKEFKRLPEIKFEHVDVGQAVDVMVLIDKLAAERRDEGGAAVMRCDPNPNPTPNANAHPQPNPNPHPNRNANPHPNSNQDELDFDVDDDEAFAEYDFFDGEEEEEEEEEWDDFEDEAFFEDEDDEPLAESDAK